MGKTRSWSSHQPFRTRERSSFEQTNRARADAQQPCEYFACELRRMPDVGCLQTGNEFEGFRPIGPRITRDGGFRVARGAVLHVRRLGRTVSVQACAISPFTIELNSVRRIGDQQLRLRVTEEAPDNFGLCAIATGEPVISEEPQIAQL